MSSVREATNQIIKMGLAPMFKRHGFRKTGLNFYRRLGTVGHHFNLQLSQWNHDSIGHFYLNAGVMFDDLKRLLDKPIPHSVKCSDCEFQVRFENIDPQMPRQIDIDEKTNIEEVAKWLTNSVEANFVLPLSAVSSTKDFLATGWLNKVPWDFPAMVHYVLGNKAEARRLVELQAQTFADRGCTFEHIAKTFHFSFDQGIVAGL